MSRHRIRAGGKGRENRVHRRCVDVLARLALIIAAVVLTAATATLLAIESTADRGPPSRLSQAVTVGDARFVQAYYGACLASDQSRALVILAITGFDRRALTVSVTASLCTPPELLARLRVRRTGRDNFQTLTRRDRFGGVIARARYVHTPVGVEYQAVLPGPGAQASEPTERDTTLGHLLQGFARNGAPAASLGSFVLPVAAAPRRYPFDWYAIRGELSVLVGDSNVSVPTGTVSTSATGATGGPLPELPFSVMVFRAADIAPFVVRATATQPQGSAYLYPRTLVKTSSRRIGITLERDTATRLFVVLVACIPFLLGILLSLTLFASRPAGRARVGPEALTGVSAALLAILPIRLVLVPADVTDLTLVDYWLGFEMALLAAVACLAVRRTM